VEKPALNISGGNRFILSWTISSIWCIENVQFLGHPVHAVVLTMNTDWDKRYRQLLSNCCYCNVCHTGQQKTTAVNCSRPKTNSLLILKGCWATKRLVVLFLFYLMFFLFQQIIAYLPAVAAGQCPRCVYWVDFLVHCLTEITCCTDDSEIWCQVSPYWSSDLDIWSYKLWKLRILKCIHLPHWDISIVQYLQNFVFRGMHF